MFSFIKNALGLSSSPSNLTVNGIPLGDVVSYFNPPPFKASTEGNALVLDTGMTKARIEAQSAKEPNTKKGRIRAVVKITADAPEFITTRPIMTKANRFASLGSFWEDQGRIKFGARLTVYEQDPWDSLFRHLVSMTATIGYTGLMYGMTAPKNNPLPSASNWGARELEEVSMFLKQMSVCNWNAKGLSAEFGLEPGAMSAMMGHKTALLTLDTRQPHPGIAGGLLCILKMPYQISSKDAESICTKLNQMEMAAEASVPHIGAWIVDAPGESQAGPLAYACFLPNQMSNVGQLAALVSMWSYERALWAEKTVKSLGLGR